MVVKKVIMSLTGRQQHIQTKGMSSLNAGKTYVFHYKQAAIQIRRNTSTSGQKGKAKPPDR